MTKRSLSILLGLCALCGCGDSGGEPAGPSGPMGDGSVAMLPDARPRDDDAGGSPPDAGSHDIPDAAAEDDAGGVTLLEGTASGTEGGRIEVTGDLLIEAGEELVIEAGSTVVVADGARIAVEGTLRFAGTGEGRIFLGSEGQWLGLRVLGTLDAKFVDIGDASQCVTGDASSSITIEDSTFQDCRSSLALGNGAVIDRTTIIGGSTVSLSAGTLAMRDSVIDFQHPTISPDCTHTSGGTLDLDHVRFTGCHCPLHLAATDAPIMITNSIFDGSTNPLMIANTSGTLTGNHFLGTGSHLLDIGGSIDVQVAGNYYGGAPRVGGGDAAQFHGYDDYLEDEIPGAGPR